MVHVFFIFLILSDVLHPDLDKAGVVLFGVLGLSYIFTRSKTRFTYVELIFLLFVFYLTVSIAFYDHLGYAPIYSALFILQYGLLNYIVVKINANPGYVSKLFVCFVSWQSVIAIIGVVDFVLFYYGVATPIRDYIISWKTDSFYSNPNPFGIMSAVALSLALTGYVKNRKLFPFIAIINGLAILCSGSSMAFILPIVFYIVKLPGRKMIISTIICLLAGTYIFLLNGFVINYIEVFNKRIDIWQYGLQMWQSSPYVGIGTGNFQLYNYLVPGNDNIDASFGLHSLFMWLIIETGIIGFVIFGMFILSFCYFTRKKGEAKLLIPLLLMLLVSQVTEFYMDHEEIFILIFWVIIAAGIARRGWSENEQKV